MTVGELLGGAFGILARRRKELLIWSVIQLVMGAVLFGAMMPFLSSALEAQQVSADGAPPSLPPGFGLFFLVYLVLLLWLLMLFSGVVRMCASSGEDRFAWLRFGMDEVRLIGLVLLYVVASIVLWTVVALVGGVLFGIATVVGAGAGIVIMGVIMVVACICGAIWLAVRISLIAPITLLDGELAIRKGWRATKGHFWTLFLTYLVMTIGYLIAEVILLAIMSPALLSGMANPGDPQQAIEAQRAMIVTLTTPSARLILLWIVGTLIGTVAMAYYYAVAAKAAIAATGHSGEDLAELEGHFQ